MASALEVWEPAFRFTIGWSETYDELLIGSYPRTTPIDDVLEEARKRGRVILHAEGGTGKTSILRRVFLKAMRDGHYPVLVDLRAWRPPLFDAWESWRGNNIMRAKILLSQVAQPTVDEDLLAALPADQPRFILVDGLNEVPAHIGQDILECLDSFARRHPASAVVVTDRLIRRMLPGERWGLARVGRLSGEEIARVLKRETTPGLSEGLLGMAFFLDMALKEGLDSSSGSVTFHAYFVRHVGFTHGQIEASARAAFEAYAARQTRTFDLASFKATAGESATAMLVSAGAIASDNGSAYFKHHLFHDYLASVWLATHPSLWARDSFDAVTFRASSFDALSLTLEQMEESGSADRLLRRIYDWNFYGSAYALAKGRNLGSVEVSRDMETALLAMLAERRTDIIRATAERVTDALRLFPSALARRFLEVADLNELLDVVGSIDFTSSELHDWRRLFTIRPGADAPGEVVELITDADSLTGWTAANVLRRVRLSPLQQTRLRTLLSEASDATLRWRVAHALGAHPSPGAVEALFAALSDPDRWVRYGAIRSLVEGAARDESVRQSVLDRLAERVEGLIGDERTLEELERALLLTNPPGDWIQAVEPLLENLWAASETLDQQDRWRQVAYNVQRSVTGSVA